MDYTAYEKNHWYKLKQVEDLVFHWRINSRGVYEVVCELFDNKELALCAAKNIYVTMLYNLLKKGIKIKNAGCELYERSLFVPGMDGSIEDYPESSFFWTPKCQGGIIGPGVYEVPESFKDFDREYKYLVKQDIIMYASTDTPVFIFNNYDTSPFGFSKTVQPLLNTIVQADSAFGIGLKMTLYCGLLEYMAEDQIEDAEKISEIDLLIERIKSSNLSQEDKKTVVSRINSTKNISSRKKCRLVCEKYAKDQYGSYSTKSILDDAYHIRSVFSHGGDCRDKYNGPGSYIKFVVLDVLAGYAKDTRIIH